MQRAIGHVDGANHLADYALENLDRQNEQLLRIQEGTDKMESTLKRTKKHLKYFGKSFCCDKVVLTLLTLIFLLAAGNIALAFMGKKK